MCKNPDDRVTAGDLARILLVLLMGLAVFVGWLAASA